MTTTKELVVAVLGTVLVVVEVSVVVLAMERRGLTGGGWKPDTWHGRPVSQDDHDPEGPRFGFVLFMLFLFALMAVNFVVVETLVGTW